MVVTACSAVFFDHYLDLLDSLAQLDLRPAYDIGLIDLGLEPAQRAELTERGVLCVEARWPVDAPVGHDRIEYLAFAGKPFARDFFPGYELYVWMDADLWAQTPDFWNHLIDGALAKGLAVPVEYDPNYAPMRTVWKLWMLRHFARTYGIGQTRHLMKQPVLNNGVFAVRANAPHWEAWQAHFRRMVAKTGRMIAVDQLALISTLSIESLPCALLDATDNWVCSLATPAWDPERGLFVRPTEFDKPISVMHLTTPSRERMFDVPTTDGGVQTRYLYRPGGRVLDQMKKQTPGASAAQSTSAPTLGSGSTSRLASGR